MIENQNKQIQDLKLSEREQHAEVRNQDKDIRELENSLNELENTCNSLNEQLDNADERYNTLLEKFNALQAKTTDLADKLNKSVKLNKQYTNSFLSECAINSGVNPKNVVLNESITTPNKIKQLVEEVKDRQDRYNRLPISYEQPTTVNILKENINSKSVEEDDLESFLTSVQNQF